MILFASTPLSSHVALKRESFILVSLNALDEELLCIPDVGRIAFSAPLATDADEAQVNGKTCTYDYIGRRATKKEEEITTDAEGNETTAVFCNHRFIYAYTPFGSVITSGDIPLPIPWSSEYYGIDLLVKSETDP